MDTNGDGAIDMYDDMYTPYYPGDDWVDWVGMSIFHFGQVRGGSGCEAGGLAACCYDDLGEWLEHVVPL
jgi:hypothetical protein